MYEHLAVTNGADDCPVILHVPHASRHIPAEIAADFVATPEQVEEELDRVTDFGTDTLARTVLGSSARAWLAELGFSRLVADPGRFYSQRDSMEASGRGAVYTRLTDGELLRPVGYDDSDLKAEYFHPYNDAMGELVAGRLRATGTAVIIDVHSYRRPEEEYRIHQGSLLPDVCVGTHSIHSPAILTDTAARIFTDAGFTVTRNTPFTGVYIPVDFEMNPQVLGIMLEFRDDLLQSDSSTFEALASGMASLIAAAQDIAGTGMGRPQ